MPRRQTPIEDLPLSFRFQDGPPTRGPRDRGSPLTNEEKMYIIYRWKGGVPLARIARELGLARSTVSAFVQDLFRCPSLLLTLPLTRVTREPANGGRGHSSFLCLLCAFRGTGGEARARDHLVRDLIPWARGSLLSVNEADRYVLARREAKMDAVWKQRASSMLESRPLLGRLLGRPRRSRR